MCASVFVAKLIPCSAMTIKEPELRCLSDAQAPRRAEVARDHSVKWDLQSDLLYELMTYGDGHQRAWANAGNWNNVRSSAPRAVITWLATRALKIERLPWLHDRVFSKLLPAEWNDLLEPLRDLARCDAATQELRALHTHVVTTLQRYELDPLVLSRSVDDSHWDSLFGLMEDGYATRLARMACAAARLDRPHFSIPIDVLSSWCPGGYPLPVTMTCALPASWIGWGCNFVASRDRDRTRHAVESDEWVIACPHPEGILHVPTFEVSAWSSFRASKTSRHRADHLLSSEQRGRLSRLRIDDSLYPSSDHEARDLLAAGAQAYGPMTSGYQDRPFNPHGSVSMNWSERLMHALHVLGTGRPKR